MRRAVWLTLVVAVNAVLATLSSANTNSCVSATDGFWDEARLWSLGKAPSIKQSAILITNAASETITIDGTTATKFKSTMTVSNLSLSAPSGSADTLFLDNTGTISLHVLNDLTIGITSDNFPGGVAELISSNSMLIVDGLLGGQLEDDGTMIFIGGSLITTNCTLRIDPSFAVALLIVSNGITQARDVSIDAGENGSGTIKVIGGTMTLSSTLSVGGSDQDSQGSLLVANGGVFVVTNGTSYIGVGFQCFGSTTVTNATMLVNDLWVGDAYHGGGALSIESGTVTLLGSLILGASGGDVSLNGGMLIVTNNSTTIGWYMGSDEITVEDGLFLAREILVGTEYQEGGVLTINGGTTLLSSYLRIGPSNYGNLSDGHVFVNGGELIVTNDDIMLGSDSRITVSGGLLAANYINDFGGSFVASVFSISSGSVTAMKGITLGDCPSGSVGQIFLTGGQLIVTNSAHTGYVDVQSGQLVLTNGVLQVDKLVMTNNCSQFIHTGGTLLVGSVVLDPNAFAITSVAREGNDLRVTWLMGPGATNALQVSSGGSFGGYGTNGFADIFVVTNNTTAGTVTNFLDVGAGTNRTARYYRARLGL